ncbi:MAG: flagellar assembly protein FliW [Firmicutes bacterium]|nr:flagellar assembly protein FliW [Bacillota bacterium]
MTDAAITLEMDPPLPGFEEITSFTLTPVPDNPCFAWLEAKNGPQFLLAKPEFFFSGYLQQVKTYLPSNFTSTGISVYVIITLADRIQDMTANLLAPLLVDTASKRAGQHILYDSAFTTRHYLFPPEKRRQCG